MHFPAPEVLDQNGTLQVRGWSGASGRAVKGVAHVGDPARVAAHLAQIWRLKFGVSSRLYVRFANWLQVPHSQRRARWWRVRDFREASIEGHISRIAATMHVWKSA
jgi:hypothetical protein